MTTVPYLIYSDAPSALEFLCLAFGFTVTLRIDGPGQSVGHAELELGDGRLMLSSAWPDAGFRSPSDLDGVHTQVWCEVEDVDAHYARAMDAGAIVIGPPADQKHGARTYRAIDLEGHRWMFASRVR